MGPGFLCAGVLLLIVCDRLGSVPILVSALQDVARERRRAILLRGRVIVAIAVELIRRGIKIFAAGL